MFSISRGAGDDSGGGGSAEADQSSSKKQQPGSFSHGVWVMAGFVTGIGLAFGVLSSPVAFAAVGLTEAMSFVPWLTGFGLALLTASVWGILEGAINWLHARVCSESVLSYCTTGAKVGMLIGSAGIIIAGSIYPPITIACLAAVGCAVTPLTFALAAGAVLVGCTAVFDIGAAVVGPPIYNRFHAESADTPNALGN